MVCLHLQQMTKKNPYLFSTYTFHTYLTHLVFFITIIGRTLTKPYIIRNMHLFNAAGFLSHRICSKTLHSNVKNRQRLVFSQVIYIQGYLQLTTLEVDEAFSLLAFSLKMRALLLGFIFNQPIRKDTRNGYTLFIQGLLFVAQSEGGTLVWVISVLWLARWSR